MQNAAAGRVGQGLDWQSSVGIVALPVSARPGFQASFGFELDNPAHRISDAIMRAVTAWRQSRGPPERGERTDRLLAGKSLHAELHSQLAPRRTPISQRPDTLQLHTRDRDYA
jgi:hypothetical protein